MSLEIAKPKTVKPKVDDYVEYWDSAYKRFMFAWIDEINVKNNYVGLQCDDGHRGHRGFNCHLEEIRRVHKPKIRPVCYYKGKLCPKCDKYEKCHCACKDTIPSMGCPYSMEFLALGAKEV